ncbi:glycosyltransferase [Commensalibacter oyaizuii]|uniref:Glycosyltransferase n=1 Tax=Commensalibacter oyaizuii TaxID=3043873 RepID=A0ABT6PYA2_9PROT|nr:glycosyltransferase [Commensalibacter sp. TBRC 16381]MDI2089839.1 glycosyltransferase [Commensalibacter sp. TBRC 16381]
MAPILEHSVCPKHQNRWCLILVKNNDKNQQHIPLLASLHHYDSNIWEETLFIHNHPSLPASWQIGITFIAKECDKVRVNPIHHHGGDLSIESYQLTLYPLSRIKAACFLGFLKPTRILKALIGSPLQLTKRLRIAINQNCTQTGTYLSYTHWCKFYDQWTSQDKIALQQSIYFQKLPDIHIRLYAPQNAKDQRTAQSIGDQWASLQQTKSKINYVAIIQNNEILSPHALMVFADQAARYNFPAALYADSDEINLYQHRTRPLFKPDVGFPVLLSGLLTQDVWVVRQDIIQAFHKIHSTPFQSAYAHRLALAIYIYNQHLSVRHIPFILSHRHTPPTPQILAETKKITQKELQQYPWETYIQKTKFPFEIQFSSDQEPITLVIPTTIQSKTIYHCIHSVLTDTDYPNFKVVLVISQSTPLTKKQRFWLRPLLVNKNLKVLWLKEQKFNFSKSCNYGIQHSQSPFIAIVNDDIQPKDPQWLHFMMGHMQDTTVGAVGAKLYYPNGQIQHGGIIMGAASVCEHAGRFKNNNYDILNYDHDVSAVTGACMVIRRSAYNKIQGFNEKYEIAYNDIDFCLRLRQENFRIIQCQHARLIHYESLSLGNHYTGERAGKERQEMISIRHQWHQLYDHDPFYNPNLSLQRGMDYQLAFPPYVTKPFAQKNKFYD